MFSNSDTTEENNCVKSFKQMAEVNKQQLIFLGSGESIASEGYSIRSKSPNAAAALEQKHNEWFFTINTATTVTFPFYFKTKSIYKVTIY